MPTHGGQRQRGTGEEREQERVQLRLRQGSGNEILEGTGARNRDAWVYFADGAPDNRHQSGRATVRRNHERRRREWELGLAERKVDARPRIAQVAVVCIANDADHGQPRCLPVHKALADRISVRPILPRGGLAEDGNGE